MATGRDTEMLGALVAIIDLVKASIKARKYYKLQSRSWNAFDRQQEIFEAAREDLFVVFKENESLVRKYECEIPNTMDPEMRQSVSEITCEISQQSHRCRALARSLRTSILGNRLDVSEFNSLRRQLQKTIAEMKGLQQALKTLQGLRISDANVETDQYAEPSKVRLKYGCVLPCSIPSEDLGRERGLRYLKSERLQRAVERGDLPFIDKIIESEKQDAGILTTFESMKATALSHACRHRRVSVIEHLLEQKAATEIWNSEGFGIVHRTIGTIPAIHNPNPDIIDILRMLVKHGASLSKRDKTKFRRTSLHWCIITRNLAALIYFLRKAPDTIDTTDAHRKTPLYLACEDRSPDLEIIHHLLANGATFGKRRRCKIAPERKKARIEKMLDHFGSLRPLTLSKKPASHGTGDSCKNHDDRQPLAENTPLKSDESAAKTKVNGHEPTESADYAESEGWCVISKADVVVPVESFASSSRESMVIV